jgi:hypothetical protein
MTAPTTFGNLSGTRLSVLLGDQQSTSQGVPLAEKGCATFGGRFGDKLGLVNT